jgi:hypothetical protein
MTSISHTASELIRIRVVMVPFPPRHFVRDLADQIHSLFDDLVREPLPGDLVEIVRRLR